ncbi:hypothetical protein C2E23DRAFT_727102 [Lenzites betulinus]|nr:hypothetical protein C2E23DRAFT_727102 [Lenzites betulinus]
MFQKRAPHRTELLTPPPDYLKNLVLDYLVHNCHIGAARAFVNECEVKAIHPSETRPEDGWQSISVRELEAEQRRAFEDKIRLSERHVRNNILTGHIDEATELLKKWFPGVLVVEEEYAPPPHAKRFKIRPAASINPTHLALNLRIQAFVEAARTIPLLYYPIGSDTPLPHPPLLSAASRSTASGDESSESDAELSNVQLLHRAQSLYSEVNRLPLATDRVLYLSELGHVGGLLAYTVPERSPLATYMTQARREALSEQIDDAILFRMAQPLASHIALSARYTTAVWSMLNEKAVPIPPRNKWPAHVALPPTELPASRAMEMDTGSLENAIPPKKPTPDKETDEVLPRFDLHLLVESPPQFGLGSS